MSIKVSELFNNYQQNYKLLSEQIVGSLIQLTNQSPDQLDGAVNQIKEEISQAEQCLKHMELEASSLSAHPKREIMNSIKMSKKDLLKIEKDLRRVEQEKAKTNLFGDRPQMSQSLLKQEDRLIEQNFKLLGAKQAAFEAEGTAIEIQKSLHEQSNGLKNSIRKTQEVRDDLGVANAIVNRMKLRIQQRRLVVYSVFGLVTVFACYIVYTWLS